MPIICGCQDATAIADAMPETIFHRQHKDKDCFAMRIWLLRFGSENKMGAKTHYAVSVKCKHIIDGDSG